MVCGFYTASSPKGRPGLHCCCDDTWWGGWGHLTPWLCTLSLFFPPSLLLLFSVRFAFRHTLQLKGGIKHLGRGSRSSAFGMSAPSNRAPKAPFRRRPGMLCRRRKTLWQPQTCPALSYRPTGGQVWRNNSQGRLNPAEGAPQCPEEREEVFKDLPCHPCCGSPYNVAKAMCVM